MRREDVSGVLGRPGEVPFVGWVEPLRPTTDSAKAGLEGSTNPTNFDVPTATITR